MRDGHVFLYCDEARAVWALKIASEAISTRIN